VSGCGEPQATPSEVTRNGAGNIANLGARRILADFLIGAHAAEHDYQLMTGDVHLYRAAFPTLKIETI